MELTLGPVLFEWKREEILRFYGEAAAMPVDRVYLGEVVCVKKKGFLKELDDIVRAAEMLRKAGKKVVLSSLAVVSNEEELDATRELLKLPYPVEANDMCVFNMARAGGSVFAGPHITSYNAPTIEFLKSVGVERVTFPVELSRDSIACNIKNTGVPAEVFAHGKVPLAFSWRCYTSRAYGLNKAGCRMDCARHPEGMEIKTLEGEGIFTLNGTSILSASTYTLIEFTDDLREIGVEALRISPQHKGTAKVADVWRRRLDNAISGEEALSELKDTSAGGFSNGWYCGKAGKDYVNPAGARSGAF